MRKGQTGQISLFKRYELWKVEIQNPSDVKRTLRAFTYLEFSGYEVNYDIQRDWPRYYMTGFREGNAVVFDSSDDFINVEERLSF